MMKWLLVRLLQIFIIACLIDGFLDISFPLITSLRGYYYEKLVKIPSSENIEPTPPARQLPGIGNIAAAYSSPGTNVSATGRRSNGNEYTDNFQLIGLMLGSSTAFGVGVSDNQTISAHLELLLKNIRIDNYSGLGQTITENILRWYSVQNYIIKPDFVIIAGAAYQLHKDCIINSSNIHDRNIILYIFKIITRKLFKDGDSTTLCTSEKNADLAIHNSVSAIKNAIEFGRKQGIPFYIVYLPTPYDSNVNVGNLLKRPSSNAHITSMRGIYTQYHNELVKLKLPEFIDLSNSLPLDRMYFLDDGGHISAEGNKLIAKALLERIRENPILSTKIRGL